MNKYKISVFFNYFLLAIYVVADIVLGIIWDFDIRFYYSTIAFMIAASLTYLIFMIIKLMVNKDYSFRRYTPALHSSYTIVAVLSYYVLNGLKHYDEYYYLYWLLLILPSIITTIVFSILNSKVKDEKPKIVANRH